MLYTHYLIWWYLWPFLQLQEETAIICGLVPVFKDLPLGKVTEQRFIIKGWQNQSNACGLIMVSQWQKVCHRASYSRNFVCHLVNFALNVPSYLAQHPGQSRCPLSSIGWPWIITSCAGSDPASLSSVTKSLPFSLLALQVPKMLDWTWPDKTHCGPLASMSSTWSTIKTPLLLHRPTSSSKCKVTLNCKEHSGIERLVMQRWSDSGRGQENKSTCHVEDIFTPSRPNLCLPALKTLATIHPRFARIKEILLWNSL